MIMILVFVMLFNFATTGKSQVSCCNIYQASITLADESSACDHIAATDICMNPGFYATPGFHAQSGIGGNTPDLECPEIWHVTIELGQSNSVASRGIDTSVIGKNSRGIIWNVDYLGGQFAANEPLRLGVNTGGSGSNGLVPKPQNFSPGAVAFVQKNRTNISFFKFAVGGSYLNPSASSASEIVWHPDANQLYSRLVEEWGLYISDMNSKNRVVIIDEIIWNQYESDSSNNWLNPNYAQHFFELRTAFESVIGQTPTWILWRGSDNQTVYPAANVQLLQSQQELIAQDPKIHLIYTNNLPVSTDNIHYTDVGLVQGAQLMLDCCID